MRRTTQAGKPDPRRSIGVYGETIAVEYMLEKGYAVLDRNWRCRTGELDVVARTGNTIIIVEVRTRRAGGRFGTAVESVDFRKQFQVRSTAEVYLSMNKLHGSQIRFDVIAITLTQIESEPVKYEVMELKHLESAF
ncbi:YraN family protein [Paenibacillus rhizovicinus]|uniref:UPF0102 protein GZH47_04010 n=1 Tax=Paenibacillus rhizovicinus TaxID=2704463 RepID=A0A6C0NWI3_9BACL|nr:YraN family protein [Paenibacillus rhizovicinus]QHW30083.1 YraN family protein [Paenibacillus rhizovicinus]